MGDIPPSGSTRLIPPSSARPYPDLSKEPFKHVLMLLNVASVGFTGFGGLPSLLSKSEFAISDNVFLDKPAHSATSAIVIPVIPIAALICAGEIIYIMLSLYDRTCLVSSSYCIMLDSPCIMHDNENSKGDRPTTNLNDHPPTHTMTKEMSIMHNTEHNEKPATIPAFTGFSSQNYTRALRQQQLAANGHTYAPLHTITPAQPKPPVIKTERAAKIYAVLAAVEKELAA